MIEETKFRAWDCKDKKMITDNMSIDWNGNLIMHHSTGDRELIFMQYTGQMDKNEKEICVGDIWSDGRSKYHIKSLKHFYWLMFIDQMHIVFDEGEIIGNIHENPKLLEEL